MKINEVVLYENELFYHGSCNYLPIGTILKPRHDYEHDWGGTDFYKILEKYRPKNMLAHKESIFMVDNDLDLDMAGGCTDWIFIIKPLTNRIERHDMNWSSEISGIAATYHDSLEREEQLKNAALNYWGGVPYNKGESLWEYLTPSAEIIKVEEF